jgi:hypothetical protein
VELDTGAKLDTTECAEVSVRSSLVARTLVVGAVGGRSAATMGGASTGGGHVARAGAAPVSSSGRGGVGKQRGQNPSCNCERGRTAQSGVSDAGEWMRMTHEVRMGSHSSDAGEWTRISHVRMGSHGTDARAI